MPIYITIIITLGITFTAYGLISKIVEITAEKTAKKMIEKLNLTSFQK